MIFDKRLRLQLAILLLISMVAGTVMSLGYMRLPDLLFGIGHYEVTVELPVAAGLYPRANVTYRGTEVGEVKQVDLTDTGVEAVLSLKSDVKIPSDLNADVHSQTAIGEQFIALLPRNGTSPPLKGGDVIPRNRTTIPPDISDLLAATNRGLQAIPQGSLKTMIDEAYTAVGGLGPEISRFVKGSIALAIDARANLDSLTALIDDAAPVLDTQTDTSSSVQNWAAHLSTITQQLQANDSDVRGILRDGARAFDESRQLFDRLQPTLPILLANLVAIGDVAVAYRPNLEQLLVLMPQGAATQQSIMVANHNTKMDYNGAFLSFNLNINLPPVCKTGFLPAQQQRVPSDVDAPTRPFGDFYCRIPQDHPYNVVRGARNIPCETRPGKRAPTVKMCESDEEYIPLNDGNIWSGDPNATYTGQSVPQLAPGAAASTGQAAPSPAAPPIAVAEYDPATGNYVGPDGNLYSQSNLVHHPEEQTWQSMLTPPADK